MRDKPVEALVCQVLEQDRGVLGHEGLEQKPLRFKSRLFSRCAGQRIHPPFPASTRTLPAEFFCRSHPCPGVARFMARSPARSVIVVRYFLCGHDRANYAQIKQQGQASIQCPGSTSRHGGSTCAAASTACGQRVRNRHPLGGFTGLGKSPASTILSLSLS